MRALVSVGKRLGTLPDRESKTQRLLAELSMLNLNLPARVWLPLHARALPHYVVRVPAQAASVLNSKDKAPYIIYCEVVTVPCLSLSPVPAKIANSLRHVKSEEQLGEQGAVTPVQGSSTVQGSLTPTTVQHTASHSSLAFSWEDGGCWSQDDDEISAQYRVQMARLKDRDTISQVLGRNTNKPAKCALGSDEHCLLFQMSCESTDSREPVFIAAGDIR